jgi:hypothetical protein
LKVPHHTAYNHFKVDDVTDDGGITLSVIHTGKLAVSGSHKRISDLLIFFQTFRVFILVNAFPLATFSHSRGS